jgi:hypothetical protein
MYNSGSSTNVDGVDEQCVQPHQPQQQQQHQAQQTNIAALNRSEFSQKQITNHFDLLTVCAASARKVQLSIFQNTAKG